jgi:hypothetical protein
VLRERFADPYVLTLVCANKQYEVVSSSIVGVEEVRDYAQKAEATRKKDELILIAQLFEDLLLELL